MGLIFKDIVDDQQESLIKTLHIGNTWEFRYLRARYTLYMILAAFSAAATTAVIDYTIIKLTDHSGIVGWLFQILS